MECERAREAISALIDGEDPGVPDGALDAHLAGCAACRGWQQRAHVLTRRARLGGSFLDHDLAGQVLAAVPVAPARRRLRLGLRAALLVVAAAQLAITVPLLVLGHDQDAGTHAAHELGSFDLALAIAFAVGAIRPALSAGLACTCAIAAGGLAGTAVADLIGGQAIGADEAQHLIAVAGAVLLIWQARTAGTSLADAGSADASGWPQGVPSSGAAAPGTVSPLARPPRLPGDGAARVAAGDGAAQVTADGGAARVAAADTAGLTPGGRLPDAAGAAGITRAVAGRDGTGHDPGGARRSQPGQDGGDREAVA
jgi:predicted anti-sigma-YlaC factor YlaD